MNTMKTMRQALLIFGLLIAIPLTAGEDDLTNLKQTLSRLFPGDISYKVTKTPVPGLFEVDFGDSFMYITGDGQYAVKGDIIHMVTNTNLTDVKRDGARLETMSAITEADTIVYPSKTKRTTMTVFTDIDCSYCRKLHQEMNAYNKQGIEVRYVFYPRAGLGSVSHQKATSVWCADDQRKALDTVKGGKRIEKRDCDTPILKHIEVANKLGVNSTPTLLFDDGSVLPGYIPAARLALILKQRKVIP